MAKTKKHLRVWLSGAALALATASTAAAQSAYGCRDLLLSNTHPTLEGEGGQFFRVSPDLISWHGITDTMVAQMADLSARLTAVGTQLVYVPIPTKSLALPQNLPPMAAALGYDVELAASVYGRTLSDLDKVDVTTVDARTALRQVGTAGAAPFFGTDARLTPSGTQALASAIAETIAQLPQTESLAKGNYQSVAAGQRVLSSPQHRWLQDACDNTLPEPRFEAYDTQRMLTLAGGSVQPGARPGRITLVTSDIAGDPDTNLDGFLAEASGFEVAPWSAPDADALPALLSYLTSDMFRTNPPDVLVWTHPTWQSLAEFGSRPLREAAYAATHQCAPAPGAFIDRSEGRVQLAITSGQADALFFDAGGSTVRQAQFEFVNRNGMTYRRTIERQQSAVSTGRFYLPLNGLPSDIVQVTVTTDSETAAPRLALCR